jgi:hypothetical protein
MTQLHFSKATLLLAMTLAMAGFATAQDNSPASAQSNSANKKAPSAKPKKTWTDDDISALHPAVDSRAEQKQSQTQNASDESKNPPPAQNTSGSKEPPRDKPPLLSDPKTVESADKMIAWEERDIAAQEEFVIRLKTQLESAPVENRDHLQKLIIERQQIIADTRKERDGLVAQRKGLEKKAAGTPAGESAAQPPQ